MCISIPDVSFNMADIKKNVIQCKCEQNSRELKYSKHKRSFLAGGLACEIMLAIFLRSCVGTSAQVVYRRCAIELTARVG